MSSLEEFESALKDVVSTRRVSLSKMNKLSEVAKKCFENDVQMVSMLYRTHKSLEPQYKVPSLYAFDALARAARTHALKHGFTGDAQPGNSATFLLKLEAVLEGLFQDMSSGVPEGKEKAKKILDIWTKSTTFPPAVLTRLENVLKGDDAPVPAPVSDAVIEPVTRSAPPQVALSLPANVETPADPASQAVSVQATLLALLSQASNVPISMDGLQTATNNSQTAQVPVPHLDTHQLKLFQQLTQTVNSSEIKSLPIQTPLPPHPPAPTTASSDIVAGSSNSHTHWNNNSRNAPNKSWDAGHVGRNFLTPSSFEENDHHGHRGRFRGGGYRFRGRGRFGGDRDREGYRDRFHDNARSPGAAQHGRRSRSRSPPRNRYGAAANRREVKPYSPPHRPSIADQADLDLDLDPSCLHPGVDEFGREIRPSSDDDGSEKTLDDSKQAPLPPPPPPPATHMSPTSPLAAEAAPVSGEHELSSTMSATSLSQAATPATNGSDALLPQGGEGPGGLASFDYSSFDPTVPASWEALGQAWAVTNGRRPSQEELMMFVMEITVSMANQQAPVTGGPAMQQGNQRTGQGHWMGEPRGGGPPRGGRGRGAFGTTRGGRGGFAYDGQARWNYGDDDYSQGTDAVVLGEHADAQDSSGWAQGSRGGGTHEQQVQAGLGEEGDQQTGSQGATGGRMQEVGDGNWVFTRNDGSS